MVKILPAILSGGSGSRLWPLSRRNFPKQFLPLFEGDSLFQKAVKRTCGELFLPPLVISNRKYSAFVGEQMEALCFEEFHLILEPEGRNTAAAAALSVLFTQENSPDALVLLLPSDHLIEDQEKFYKAVTAAVEPAQNGQIVVFGIKPSEPHIGYGYIQTSGDGAVQTAARFVEKPDLKTAKAFVEEGHYLWNAGVFLFSVETMHKAFMRYAPDIWEGAQAVYEQSSRSTQGINLNEARFAKVRAQSLDFAIMEAADNVSCVPMETGWSDLGSWASLWQVSAKTEAGNAAVGEARFPSSRNCLAYSEGTPVYALGLEDLVIVHTKDALLVASKDRCQQVKSIVETLEFEQEAIALCNGGGERCAATSKGIDGHISLGDGYRVEERVLRFGEGSKRETQGQSGAHWVVVSGMLQVDVDGTSQLIKENQSVFVAPKASYRFFNAGQGDLRVVAIHPGNALEQGGAHVFKAG
ncbi:mannose-1-phosphate guanylyltransferase/mannose-6-phosphate isomerase [Flexibacterium corallicola]|uniref:mannose-1-phosphate guanylyltransferase/mannose-6-phosphate isomerase n=1 Tax=Flexibacterium corallicola TaxID=3037259 RepID=UPI00286F07AB|nr:mannose-1-phosphate guanylyltransferase/mannose-6-phosphate isomerase [Pseudovibrio sp. M1P-2-3]